MEIQVFKKVSYLYGKDEFFLYTPLNIIITESNKDRDGNFTSLDYIDLSDNSNHSWNERYPFNIVENFVKDDNNLLISDYKPRFVSAMHGSSHKFMIHHERCEVLIDKNRSYTILRCKECGQESPIAINSFSIIGSVKDDKRCTNFN